MDIKIKVITEGCQPHNMAKGEWIDLSAAKTITFNSPNGKPTANGTLVSFDYKMIPLGIAVKLPKGFEAHVLPRSSTYKNRKIMLVNSMGVIDNSYCGNNDEWKFPAIAFDNTEVRLYERIAQFRIELSQKATIMQKIKWLFTKRIRIVYVDKLEDEDRGGIGSTGI